MPLLFVVFCFKEFWYDFQRLICCQFPKTVLSSLALRYYPQNYSKLFIESSPRHMYPAGKSWSPGRPLKILFDRPGDVPIRRPGDVPIWRPRDVLKWRPGDVLIWRSTYVPGRLIQDVPRTFAGRPLEDHQSTQTWMPKIFLTFLSELIRLTKSKNISTLKMYWEPSKTFLRWRIFRKIS